MNRDSEPKIALFIDYDNIAIGLREAGGGDFKVGKILERLLEKGRIIYKRAYADWYLFSDGKRDLHGYAIEMIDIPMRRNIGKNSADIRLVVDALDLCYTKEHIDTFVIGSGDSDFTPLVSKLKENDKEVIGFGLRAATSNMLANSCDEFIFLEDLVDVSISQPQMPSDLTKRQHDAFNLVIDAVAALIRENKDHLWGSLVKDTIRRKRPSFSEGQYGYSSFSQLLEDAAKHGLIGLIKDPKSGGTPVVTGFGQIHESHSLSSKSAAPSARSASLSVANGGLLLPTASAEPETAPKKKTIAKPELGKAERDEESKPVTRRRSPRKPAAPKAVAPVKEDQAEVTPKEKPKTPRKPAIRTRRPAKAATASVVKAEVVETPAVVEVPVVKEAAKPAVEPAASQKVEPSSVTKEEKPKGQPLNTRVRRRKR